MSGVEHVLFLNDACGNPITKDLCYLWNFFDGKLFHEKYLLALGGASQQQMCEGDVSMNCLTLL